jgi:hypothetical protein
LPRPKKIFVVGVQLVIALIFFIGTDWASWEVHVFFHSYYADFALPFGFYFLLMLFEEKYPRLRPWYGKALPVFLLVSASEVLQYFGIYALARIFDPFDFVAYGSGVIAAAVMDRQVLARLGFWGGAK